jgi:cytochrome c biogenesis protein CcmG/thiol:disulfide interchange protein DsbE
MERYRLRYPSVHDAGDSTSQSYGVTGFPETFFIDAKGRIVAHVSGPVEPDEIDTLVSRTLES